MLHKCNHGNVTHKKMNLSIDLVNPVRNTIQVLEAYIVQCNMTAFLYWNYMWHFYIYIYTA